jgi:hypothetical protein
LNILGALCRNLLIPCILERWCGLRLPFHPCSMFIQATAW